MSDPSSATRASRLEPLSPDLEPQVRDLAELLREYHAIVGQSLRASREVYLQDPGSVSRFLSGKRIPPRSFVERMLAVAAEQQGRKPTPGELRKARNLHGVALQVRNASEWRVEELQRALEDAREEKRHSEIRERALVQALEAHEQRIDQMQTRLDDMQMQHRMLEGIDISEAPRALEQSQIDYGQLLKDRQKLEDEAARLAKELTETHAAKEAAELRCVQLEEQLEEAKHRLAAVRGGDEPDKEAERESLDADDDGSVSPQDSLGPSIKDDSEMVVQIPERRVLRIHVGLIYLFSFAVSIYLGWVFALTSTSQHMLGIVTRWILLIPFILTLVATRAKYPSGSWVKHSVIAFALITAFFFIGFRL